MAPLPHWLGGFGYAGAVVMLFTLPHAEFLIFVFPAWVLVISIHILRVGFDEAAPARG